jgi:hypothetical protein
MLSTYGFYRSKYPAGEKGSVQEFVRSYLANEGSTRVEGLVDVYCEPPFTGWNECVPDCIGRQCWLTHIPAWQNQL